jgi:hypothetical protein
LGYFNSLKGNSMAVPFQMWLRMRAVRFDDRVAKPLDWAIAMFYFWVRAEMEVPKRRCTSPWGARYIDDVLKILTSEQTSSMLFCRVEVKELLPPA